MDEAAARRIFESFLDQKEKAIGQPLACFDDSVERIGGGWAFPYQGRAWVETRNMDDQKDFQSDMDRSSSSIPVRSWRVDH